MQALSRIRLPRFHLPDFGSPGREFSKFRSDQSIRIAKYASISLGGFLLLFLLVAGVTRMAQSLRDARQPAAVFASQNPLVLTHEPPPPYLEAKPLK